MEREVRYYHIAEVRPLVQEVSVDVDAVGLAQILGDQSPDRGQVFLLEGVLVLDV